MLNFKSKIACKILNYYFLNPKQKKYINELARMLDLDPKNTHRKLVELEKEGVLESEFMGMQKYYRLNVGFPLIKEYKQIFMKTAGLEETLRTILSNVNGIMEGYVYGSYAKDKMDSLSDIDVLVIGNHSVLELEQLITVLQKETGREINVVNLDRKEFSKKLKDKNSFISEVMSGKLIRLI
jgi:uncharacterized protein